MQEIAGHQAAKGNKAHGEVLVDVVNRVTGYSCHAGDAEYISWH